MTTGREKAAERSAHKSFERQNEYQYRASNFHRKSFDNREQPNARQSKSAQGGSPLRRAEQTFQPRAALRESQKSDFLQLPNADERATGTHYAPRDGPRVSYDFREIGGGLDTIN